MFKVGDIVEAFGVRGTIVNEDTKQVTVEFDLDDDVPYHVFYKDGRGENWHLKPSLILIERPKKKKKVPISRWINVYSHDSTSNRYIAYPSKSEAREALQGCSWFQSVELKGEYEIDEE